MNLDNQNIDWSSSDILRQIIKNIEAPLSSIIEASNDPSSLTKTLLKENSSNIIFSNSQEIKLLIDEVVKKLNGGKPPEDIPVIFKIYHSNERVQSMCKAEIKPNNISQQDTLLLKNIETEVYKKIDHKDLNLYDLSYKMAISERQLHRKIKGLLHLTPNKYIRVLRLYKAKQFIDDYLYDTISQISYAVGYYDTHYFSKLFSKQYGMYPKELLNSREFDL